MEEWRDVPGYEGIYKVSSMGRIMRCDEYKNKLKKKDRILKTPDNGDGYCQVTLSNDGKRKQLKVHNIVASAFLTKKENKNYVVDHINRDRADNRVENLRYISFQCNLLNCERSDKKLSRFNGVYYSKRDNKFRCTVYFCKLIYLGQFDNEVDAARAYDRYVIEHGLDRILNFPEEHKEVM